MDRAADEILGQGSWRADPDPVRTRHISLDRRASDRGSDRAGVVTTVQRIEKRGALETAHRALGNCGQVFRYAIATGRAKRDPTGDLRGALPAVRPDFAAITEPERVGELLRAIDGYEGSLTVRCALRLAPLVFVRPGELRAEWSAVDLDGAEWRYTVTKTDTPHIVPLLSQAVAILRELKPLTGRGRYVFWSGRSSPADERQRHSRRHAPHGCCGLFPETAKLFPVVEFDTPMPPVFSHVKLTTPGFRVRSSS